MNSNWNPEQYNKFKGQRARPFYDLLSLIQVQPFQSGIDLGCGTGELTLVLFDKLRPKSMKGIDASPEMLQKSKVFEKEGLHFELQNISELDPKDGFDLIFSNAALQWLPNHEALIPKILGWLKPGGQVAIQVPCNFDHPSHTIAEETATKMFPNLFPKGHHFLAVLPVERYAEIFYSAGMEEQVTRVEVYGHPMSSGRDVVEWTKGTFLTRYQSQLSVPDFEKFLEAYTREIVRVLGEKPYFYPFKRMLLWGKKGAP